MSAAPPSLSARESPLVRTDKEIAFSYEFKKGSRLDAFGRERAPDYESGGQEFESLRARQQGIDKK